MDITLIGSVGLAAGFITYLVVDSVAMPQWWYKFREWWRDSFVIGKAFHGKPFSCNLCMSFWVSVVLTFISEFRYWLTLLTSLTTPGSLDELGRALVSLFTCACIAFIVDRWLDKANTTVLIQG